MTSAILRRRSWAIWRDSYSMRPWRMWACVFNLPRWVCVCVFVRESVCLYVNVDVCIFVFISFLSFLCNFSLSLLLSFFLSHSHKHLNRLTGGSVDFPERAEDPCERHQHRPCTSQGCEESTRHEGTRPYVRVCVCVCVCVYICVFCENLIHFYDFYFLSLAFSLTFYH